MNLYRLLQKRADEGKPVLAALIGAGKFGSMFLSQARRTKGLQVAAMASGKPVTWADVAVEDSEAVRFRHEMEAVFAKKTEEIAQ
jgi:predicted homoserine dehydrogenase-like protein